MRTNVRNRGRLEVMPDFKLSARRLQQFSVSFQQQVRELIKLQLKPF